MNYKNNNKNDDLNIKAHLDASLDLSGISVSEELITKTLSAIKSKTPEMTDGNDKDLNTNRKVITWNRYVHSFAKVAAVILIVTAGYAMLSNLRSMKDETNSLKADKDMASYNAETEESSQEYAANYNDAGTEADDNAAIKGAADAAGIAAVDDNADSNENKIMDSESGKALQRFTVSADTSPAAVLTVRDIFLPEPETILNLIITDSKNNSITLTDKDGILDFYSVMDKYQYTNSTASDTAEKKNFIIEAQQQNESKYTMSISKNIIVEYGTDDTSSQGVYEAADIALLLDDLQVFFNKYK
jgi:hypothetical protein